MDQASELRHLVRQSAGSAAADAPNLVAVASGKRGVGTTTAAVNLAVALARLGRRVALVDADLQCPHVANLCQISPEYSISDVLCGQRTLHEALSSAAGGVHVLAGHRRDGPGPECTPQAQDRLIDSLRMLAKHADDVILDVGSGASEVNRRFWLAADKVLVVATAEDAAIMNAYAAIKLICAAQVPLLLFSLVNHAPDAATARGVHDRLAHACRRFLGVHLFAGGYLPASAEVRDACRARESFVLSAAGSEATLALEQVAQGLIAPRRDPPSFSVPECHWRPPAAEGRDPQSDAPADTVLRTPDVGEIQEH